MNSHHKMIISENVAILLSLFTHIDLIQSCSYHTILIQLAIIPIPFCYVNFTQMFFCTHLLGQIMMTNILGQIKIFAELKSCINYFIYKMIQYLVCVILLSYYYYCFWRKLQPSQLALQIFTRLCFLHQLPFRWFNIAVQILRIKLLLAQITTWFLTVC